MKPVRTITRLKAMSFTLALCASCKTPLNESESVITSSALNHSSKNTALILSTPQKRPDSQIAADVMASVFKSDLNDQDYKVEAVTASSAKETLDQIKETSARVDPSGTLIIGFSGYSASVDSLQMEDGSSVKFSELGAAVMQGREVPIRRTIYLMDLRSAEASSALTLEQLQRSLRSELLASTDWYESKLGKEMQWNRLVTDLERVKNASLSHTAAFGEVLAFASFEHGQGAMRAFVEAMKDLHNQSDSRMPAMQALADAVQRYLATEKQTSVFAFLPENAPKGLVFGELNLPEQRIKTLGLAWLNQVSRRLNEVIDGCTFGPEYAIDYNKTFLFNPSFIVTTKSGQVFHDQYFGVMSWMSRPETSASFIGGNLANGGSSQYQHLGCHERKAES